MKKITTFLFASLMIVFSANAQYYFNEVNPAGQNPGDLNNDPEQPLGFTPGYTTIFPANTTSNSWSPVQSIPFDFDFNGSPVTDYIVSNSGVLTFTTTPTPIIVPSVNNDVIPSLGIPDKSIMIWGLQQLAGNDAVASQTYGTAPNRQHWIKFLSYSAPGAAGQQWTYWSIVLEETSNKIYIVDERTFNTPLSLTIGVQIDGTTAYSVGTGSNAAPNTPSFVTNGGNASDATDNVYYEFIQGARPANSVALSSLDPIPSTSGRGSAVSISGTITNQGSATLTSVDVTWRTSNPGTFNRTETINVNLAPQASVNFTHPTDWIANNLGADVTFTVSVANPNGQTDPNTSDDVLTSNSTFVNIGNLVQKNSLFEQFTTAVCQFCPDGAWVAGQMHANDADIITTSVHSCFGQDNMTNADASLLCSTLGINAAPTGMVDRKLFPGETDVAFGRGQTFPNYLNSTWTQRAQAQAALGSPANIIVFGSYDNNTRQLVANVDVSFTDVARPGDIRVSVQLIEDSVSGSGQGWDQINAYNTQAGHPFAGRGNPIQNYQHRRVLRDILPDTWGDATVVPSDYDLNTSYVGNYTITLPANFNASRMYLVATVSYFGGSDISQYEVLNARRIKMDQITSLENLKSDVNSLSIYPNPTNLPFTNLEFNLSASKRIEARVLDITGKEVGYQDFGVMAQGNQRVQVDTKQLKSGFYFINLRVGDEVITRKISVLK